jgi:uncharacterized damage-inducible protein DinB
MQSNERTFPPLSAPERDMLVKFLQYQRDTLEWKCTGLSAAQLKQAATPPSDMTLLGLLRHMTTVEHHWFVRILTGVEPPQMYGAKSWISAWTDLDSHEVEDVVRNWKTACAESTANVAAVESLDQPAARPWDNEPVMVRWILIHMIEEYARHLGHADLLRQAIDGETGE